MVWYKVGAADETPGKSGLAHYLEHLMFKGTDEKPRQHVLAGRLPPSAARRTPSPRATIPASIERVPRDHLKEMMAFEADRMTGLVLTDAVARPELKVVLEELNMRVANNPGAQLDEQMDAALYLNHPYHRPVIGWRHEVEKLTYDDALAFYRRFYTPNNVIVVVAGDVTPDEVKADAEATYGKVAAARRNRPAGAAHGAGAGCAAHRDAGRSARRAAKRRSLLSGALGDHRQTRRRAKRSMFSPPCSATTPTAGSTRHSLSTRASRSMPAPSIPTPRSITASSASMARRSPACRCTRVEAGIDAVLDDVIQHGITADELDRAKTGLIADAVYAQDNQATLARWYGAGLATGETVAQVSAWPDRVRAVTADAGAASRAALA